MPTATTAQPTPLALPGLRALSYGTATAIPVGISRDRATVYGAALGSGKILYQSVNDGSTWTSVHTFTYNVVGLLETDNGEAIVLCENGNNGSGGPGYLYKSTGWATSHTTATWTLVLTSGTNCYFAPWFTLNQFSMGNDKILPNTSKILLCNDYGQQTGASGDQSQNAVHVYYSADYGATWTVIYNIATTYPGVAGLHIHSSAYDPYWDRIWVLFGDSNPNAAGTQQLLYSDDRGATWNIVSLDTAAWGFPLQSDTMAVFPDHILLNSDNAPGQVRMSRQGYRQLGPAQAVTVSNGLTSQQFIGTAIYQTRNLPNAPILIGQISAGSDGASVGNITASLDGGQSYVELWRDPALLNNSLGIRNVYGPTAGGVVVADVQQSSDGSVHWMLRGEIVNADAFMFDGNATFTGDGTTTVFTIAHGLGVIPTRLLAWSMNAVGGQPTITADATNLTFTFSPAPTAATTPKIAYRYAA